MTPPNVAIYNYFRHAFDFKGRASRSDFWWPTAFMLMVYIVLLSFFIGAGGELWAEAFVDSQLGAPETRPKLSELPEISALAKFFLVFVITVRLLTILPEISIAVRRFHDLNRTGWFHALFILAGLIIPFGGIVEYVWFAFPGTSGPNRFGPDPLD